MKKIAFTTQAQADVRRLDQPTAMRIFEGLRRFAQSGLGDAKTLRGGLGDFRLRIGDYRLRYTEESGTLIVRRASIAAKRIVSSIPLRWPEPQLRAAPVFDLRPPMRRILNLRVEHGWR